MTPCTCNSAQLGRDHFGTCPRKPNGLLCKNCNRSLVQSQLHFCSQDCSTKRSLANEDACDDKIAFAAAFIGTAVDEETPKLPYPQPPPLQGNLARMVFSTDPRVLQQARLKFECRHAGGTFPPHTGKGDRLTPEEDIKRLREAIAKLWDLGGPERDHEPEATWRREAETIGERVGKPWYETPQPTLVEALVQAQAEPLWSLGFKTLDLPAGAVGVLEACPQLPIRGERFVLPDAIASMLMVEDVKVGQNSCMLSADPMPGSLFSDRAFPMRMKLEVAHIGSRVRVQVRNVTALNLIVNAVLLGVNPQDEKPQVPLHPIMMNAFYGKFAARKGPKTEPHCLGCGDVLDWDPNNEKHPFSCRRCRR